MERRQPLLHMSGGVVGTHGGEFREHLPRLGKAFCQVQLRAQRAQQHRMAVANLQCLFQRGNGAGGVLALMAGLGLVQDRFERIGLVRVIGVHVSPVGLGFS